MDGETYFRWYVGRTEPRREHLAASGLIARRIKVYLPETLKKRRCGRKMRDTLEPMLPGYVFLHLPWLNEPWEVIRSTNGILVHKPFLSSGGKPCAISNNIVEAVRAVERDETERPLPRSFYVGQPVEVEVRDHYGTISSFKAVVENISKLDRQGRIRVTAQWLGGLTSMDVPATKIKAA